MATPASPAEIRAYIVERLTGDTGEPARVLELGRALAEKSAPAVAARCGEVLQAKVTVEVDAVEIARFVQARPAGSAGVAVAVAASASSPDALAIVLDGPSVAWAVGVLFGGDGSAPSAPIERDLSSIETEVAALLMQEIAEAVDASAGERRLGLKLPVQPVLSGVELQKLILRDGPALRIELLFGAGMGRIQLFIPQRVLLQSGSGSRKPEVGAPTDWGARMGDEVMRSAVMLDATMPLQRMTLGDLAELRTGQVLEMEAGAQGQATLSARGKTLFVCEFGKLGQHYTVRVKQPFDAAQDLIDELVPG